MKKIQWCYIVSGLLCLCSCADFTELNENPTRATSVSPHLLIPTVQLAHSQNHQNIHRYMAYPGGFLNQWTGDYGATEHGGKGKKNVAYMERLWITLYPDMSKHVVALVSGTANDPELANLHAIGRILKVEAFLKLTDYYGDIPYFEAGKIYENHIMKPKYDTQESIYTDFLKELREASAELSVSGAVPQNDLYFGGDLNKWKRFANSLWLRVAMRLVKVNPELARQEATAACAAGLMTSNADICYVVHEASTLDDGPGNGFANRLLSSPSASTFRMTDELLEALSSVNDPRLLWIGRCYWNDEKRTDITRAVYEKLGTYMGVPAQEFIYGGGIGSESVWAPALKLTVNDKEENITHHYQRLQPSKLITDPASPYIHLSYAETQFFLAEAAVRNWDVDTETAQEYYRKGLTAAIRQWELFKAELPSEMEIEAFVNSQVQRLGEGTRALEEINKQLWILYILDPFEAWANLRRTGMPSEYTKFYNRYPSENETGGKRPRRMQYPLEEQIKNKENLQEAVGRMGGTDDWNTSVWWDKE